jgi:hypothetical protein
MGDVGEVVGLSIAECRTCSAECRTCRAETIAECITCSVECRTCRAETIAEATIRPRADYLVHLNSCN